MYFQLNIEKHTESNNVPLNATLGAFDVDTKDVLTIQVTKPYYGQMKLSAEDRSVPKIREDYCNNGSDTREFDGEWVMPCGFELPHNEV